MMEIRLKERLVGAIVLVLAAVIFIPVLLDGPNGNRQVSREVPLPEPGAENERRTISVDLDATVPTTQPRTPAEIADRVSQPAAADSATQQQQASSAVKPERSPRQTAAQTRPSRREPAVQPVSANWTVQVGSFSRADNAEGLAAKLRQSGHAAYVSEFRDGSNIHYRVRVGGYPDRDAAQAKADEIRTSTGEPARPVPAS